MTPEFNKSAFTCPYEECSTVATQKWLQVFDSRSAPHHLDSDINFSVCLNCNRRSIWLDQKLLFPVDKSLAPIAHVAMPDSVSVDFNEARQVLDVSPRSACALLRLCVQKLCIHLAQPGKDLNTDIATLVKEGLSPKLQKAFDLVRIVGNSAVHPVQVVDTDDPNKAIFLFRLVNLIVEEKIGLEAEMDSMLASLPEDKRKQIERRDLLRTASMGAGEQNA